MKQLFNLLTAISISFVSLSQTPAGKITGSIKDGGNQTVIDAATISLLMSKDSTLVKSAVTDKEGNFQFDNVKDGDYLVSASSLGHSLVYSKSFSISSTNNSIALGELKLVPVSKSMKEVVITSKRPFIERKIDKTIINVDAFISNAGTSAMEVLEKSPGITVDKDGNISLKGKQGVLVMIDGKPSYLNAQELANLLKSMPSSNLDQIELMTNPSAKYDAAGNSGIINIKTKKNKQKGFNGSLIMAYGQGFYPKTYNSLLLNYRNGKFNVFGTLSGNYSKNRQQLNILRKYTKDDQSLDAIFEQTSVMRHQNEDYNSKLGIDFYASKKNTLGIVVSGFINPGEEPGFNTSYLKSSAGVIDSIVVAENKEKFKWKNGAVNLNFRHQYDSTGRELTADVDYVTYRSNTNQRLTNTIYTPDMMLKNMEELIGELPSDINIYSFKVDYTHPFKGGLKMESGVKSSYVETNNTAGYFNIIADEKLPDYGKTNQFNYRENINAAYVSFSKEIKKWGLQAGLRAENTNYAGDQFGNPQRQDSSFKKSYTSLFPTLFVSYNANEKNQFSFAYGRRINRPDYQALNPFLSFIDKYTYNSGNPFLRPSYANSFEIAHTYRQFLTTTLNYAHSKDRFTESFGQNGYATVVRRDNFGSADEANLSVSAQIPVAKWWTAITYAAGNYSQYNGLLYGSEVNVNGSNFIININNQFKFNKGWSAELNGFYRTKGIEGQIIINPINELGAGIQKQIFKNKGSIKIYVNDVFNIRKESGSINFQHTAATFSQKRESRNVYLNFVYRFGKPINGVQKRKTGGAGDEQNRVKSGT